MEEHGLRAFDNKILRKICGPKTDEVTGDCRRLPVEELYDLYSSPNIIRVIKCDTVGRGDVHTGPWWGNVRKQTVRRHLGVYARTTLKWIFKKWDGEWIGLVRPGRRTSGGLL
jgi:hypothetical protein